MDIGEILDDLGYGAGDAMNVDFVFIVEGKQDKSRLPLLLRNYYSEVYREDGTLSRISIITTNSCTNIKTYANLKYIDQIGSGPISDDTGRGWKGQGGAEAAALPLFITASRGRKTQTAFRR